MALANERPQYNDVMSLIDWAHTQNDPWNWFIEMEMSSEIVKMMTFDATWWKWYQNDDIHSQVLEKDLLLSGAVFCTTMYKHH